jgi:hypothetical protein
MRQRQNRPMARCVGRLQMNDCRRAATLMRADPVSVASDAADDRPLIDKFGRRHSQAVLHSWSEPALRALGIRPINPNELEEGAQPPG